MAAGIVHGVRRRGQVAFGVLAVSVALALAGDVVRGNADDGFVLSDLGAAVPAVALAPMLLSEAWWSLTVDIQSGTLRTSRFPFWGRTYRASRIMYLEDCSPGEWLVRMGRWSGYVHLPIGRLANGRAMSEALATFASTHDVEIRSRPVEPAPSEGDG